MVIADGRRQESARGGRRGRPLHLVPDALEPGDGAQDLDRRRARAARHAASSTPAPRRRLRGGASLLPVGVRARRGRLLAAATRWSIRDGARRARPRPRRLRRRGGRPDHRPPQPRDRGHPGLSRPGRDDPSRRSRLPVALRKRCVMTAILSRNDYRSWGAPSALATSRQACHGRRRRGGHRRPRRPAGAGLRLRPVLRRRAAQSGRPADRLPGLDRFVSFDARSGLVCCEAGVRLADILAVLCRRGGRIGLVSCRYARHALRHRRRRDRQRRAWQKPPPLRHLRPARPVLRTRAQRRRRRNLLAPRHAELFPATIGGLGLTGLMLRATLRLRRVEGLALETEDIRFDSVDDSSRSRRNRTVPGNTRRAWIDCAAATTVGRGIFSRARHAPGVVAPPPGRRRACPSRSRRPSRSSPAAPCAPSTPCTGARPGFRGPGGSTVASGAFSARCGRAMEPPLRTRRLHPVSMRRAERGAAGRPWSAAARDRRSGGGSMLGVLKVFGDLPFAGPAVLPDAGRDLRPRLPHARRGTGACSRARGDRRRGRRAPLSGEGQHDVARNLPRATPPSGVSRPRWTRPSRRPSPGVSALAATAAMSNADLALSA